jgi:GH24 family phage-related lysozyme (muramidase)
LNYADSDGVTTVCYGKVQEWDDRSEARKFFLEAMMNTDGAERERYSNVYFKIIRGFDYCTDSDSD